MFMQPMGLSQSSFDRIPSNCAFEFFLGDSKQGLVMGNYLSATRQVNDAYRVEVQGLTLLKKPVNQLIAFEAFA